MAARTAGSSTPCSARNTMLPTCPAPWPPKLLLQDVDAPLALDVRQREVRAVPGAHRAGRHHQDDEGDDPADDDSQPVAEASMCEAPDHHRSFLRVRGLGAGCRSLPKSRLGRRSFPVTSDAPGTHRSWGQDSVTRRSFVGCVTPDDALRRPNVTQPVSGLPSRSGHRDPGPGGGTGRRRGLKPPVHARGVWVRTPPRAHRSSRSEAQGDRPPMTSRRWRERATSCGRTDRYHSSNPPSPTTDRVQLRSWSTLSGDRARVVVTAACDDRSGGTSPSPSARRLAGSRGTGR